MLVLKLVVVVLFNQMDFIEFVDLINFFVCVGVVLFNDKMQMFLNFVWGMKFLCDYVSVLFVNLIGGIDMMGGMSIVNFVFNVVIEVVVQIVKGNKDFKKFIVLMIDGENIGNSLNWNLVFDIKIFMICMVV